jgi:hypothetical protein
MTNPNTFDDLPLKALASLQKLSDSVVGIQPIDTKSCRFFTGQLSEQCEVFTLGSEIGTWARMDGIYLYAIFLVTPNYEIDDLKEAFLRAKNAKKNDRAYARLNRNNTSKCFYVGSSRDLLTRLKQHLGYGPKGTFALQLAHWANPFELELELQCAKYHPGLATGIYQILEDTLWEDMRPMFGRKGMK